jgi:putative transposase
LLSAVLRNDNRYDLWARGYFAASSGNVTEEVVLQYIATQGQEPSESDEDFKIED